MGRRKANLLASAAVLSGLLVPAMARGQQPPLPARCEAHLRTSSKPAIGLSIDALRLNSAELPDGMSQEQFVEAIETSAGSGDAGWLDRVWDAARDVWRDRGYFQIVINVKILSESVVANVRHVSLRIHADPGPQYRIADVRMLDVNPGSKLVFPNQTLRDLIPLRPGELVNVEKADEGVEAIRRLYASHGYLDLQITPNFQMDNHDDRISLFVMLDQGDQYRVGKIVALGFGPAGKKMLNSKIKPGDVFDWNVVRNFYARFSWLMPPDASVRDDQIDWNPKTSRVNLVLDFRACPKQAAQHSSSGSAAGD